MPVLAKTFIKTHLCKLCPIIHSIQLVILNQIELQITFSPFNFQMHYFKIVIVNKISIYNLRST